jgi:response regulator RpfG family c-di-GMP phosphodiesterase
MMPRMDGYELMERIRSHPKFKKIPIIVCTAIKDHFKIKEIQSLDISGYIVKPHTTKAVLDELEKALGRQSAKTGEILSVINNHAHSKDISIYLDQLKIFAQETEASISTMRKSLNLGDRANIAWQLDQLEQAAKKFGVTGFLRIANKLEDHVLTRDQTSLATEIDYLEKERHRISETLAGLLNSSEVASKDKN